MGGLGGLGGWVVFYMKGCESNVEVIVVVVGATQACVCCVCACVNNNNNNNPPTSTAATTQHHLSTTSIDKMNPSTNRPVLRRAIFRGTAPQCQDPTRGNSCGHLEGKGGSQGFCDFCECEETFNQKSK
jgi:hypothetical protein